LVSVRAALDIDEDILVAVREIAAAWNLTAGKVISEPEREALTSGSAQTDRIRINGLRIIAPTGKAVTSEMMRELRDSGV
jgi:hypothetical protein